MNAVEDFNHAIRLIPLKCHKSVLSILAPHFSPEMLAVSVDYLNKEEPVALTPKEKTELIFQLVGDITGVTTFRHSKTRKYKYVFARQLAMFAIYSEVPQFSYTRVGNLFTPRFDHATIIHARKSMEARYSSDKSSRKIIDTLAELMAEQSLDTFKNRLASITLIT